MNRKVFLQVALPGIIMGALLLGTCLVSAWHIDRLQTNLSRLLSRNVNSLQAAQELEIRLHQLRWHSIHYLRDLRPEKLVPMEKDHQQFEAALELAQKSVITAKEKELVKVIQDGYQRYRDELNKMSDQAVKGKHNPDIISLFDSHPIRYVVEPCEELLRINKDAILCTARDSEDVTSRARLAMVVLGVLGPVGGLMIGFVAARRLRRSIYRLSVRVQDISRHLDQTAASVTVDADDDLEGLDRQLHHIYGRIAEIAEHLQQHQREMLRAQQLSATGQLAAGVAHEVRNPLTVIKMLVEAALRPNNTKPLTNQDLRVIHGEVVRLEERVQGFLNFARLPVPRRDQCDLHEIVREAVSLIRSRARLQKVEIAVANGMDAIPVSLDREQFRTVFVNLFLNALDAMPQGGRLDVDVAEENGKVRLVVADSGEGIAPEMAGRLFTPFASSKPTGTGLGLSLSRRIVDEHGGTITAHNRPEGGACFTIELSICREPAPGTEIAAASQVSFPT